MKVNDELRTFITEQLSGLVNSAAEIITPPDMSGARDKTSRLEQPGLFARRMLISENMSNEHLVAIAFRVGQILEARTAKNDS